MQVFSRQRPTSKIYYRQAVLSGAFLIFMGACSSSNDNSVDAGSVNSPFFDDFSVDTSLVVFNNQLSDDSNGNISYDNGQAVVTVNSDVSGNERIRFRLPSTTDTRYAVVALEEGTVANNVSDTDAKARARISSHLYNDTSADSCIGNIDISISSRLSRGDQYSFILSASRRNTEDCSGGEDYPLFNGEVFPTLPGIQPMVGISNRLQMTLDRENSELIVSIDDQRFAYPITTPIFDPYDGYFVVETRAEDGATAIVRVEEFGNADGSVAIPATASTVGRYNVSSSQPVAIEDGELRLEANSSGDRATNRFSIKISEQRYVKAQIRLSSESTIGTDGSIAAGTGGSLYYAADVLPNDEATGQVYAISQLFAREDGTLVAEYCAWQALNSDFSEDLHVLDGADDSGCLSFSVAPELDKNYLMGVWYDESNQQIVFTMDDEVIRHDIQTPVSSDDNLFDMRVQSRAAGNGSRAVVYVDDLRMDPSVD